MKVKIFKFIFKNKIIVIILIQIIKIIYNECSNRDNPLKLSDNTCASNCTENQFDSGKCIIDNNIIKTQWLNNIIYIKEIGFKYIDFVVFPNGDLIAEAHPFPCNSKRIIYGLKQDGRYYFKTNDNKGETPFLFLDSDENDYLKYESGISFIILNDKKYIISIGRLESNTEIIDFDNKYIYNSLSTDILGKTIHNYRGSLINLNNKNLFLYACNVKTNYWFINYIIKFEISINNLNKISASEKGEFQNDNGFSENQSLFVTQNNMIIIFYGCSFPSTHYNITVLDPNLNKIYEEKVDDSNINKNSIFQAFILKGK